MTMTDYRSLGRSGLLVSPLALGGMTFGAGRWGSGLEQSRAVFDAYVEAGGNFVDTADIYAGGRSEEMVGTFVREAGLRDRLVIATKAGFARSQDSNPHSGGNGAKAIRAGMEGSLRRLSSDYIDIYWVHVWDRVTPAEEVLRTLTDAVRAGKILHYGFSNTPSWYVAKVATMAEAHGLPVPIGLQYQYSLLDRGVELDVLPAGREFGLGMVPWSPLGGGLLTGKYGREMLGEASRPGELPDKEWSSDNEASGSTERLKGENPFGGMLFTQRNFDVMDTLRGTAGEIGRSMAEVALAWVASREGISSVLIGASRAEQIDQNIRSLDIAPTEEQEQRLAEVSALPLLNPCFTFKRPTEMRFGVASARGWQ